eukprot:TRINITY_DN112296_c0_g1_i1.p1 TRINITY_DN112296_c0_g1~~TRINITY_DN112296_c0_g1_i1.p1  ORF type:complete len:416 (+),score=102.19 TRINITY_DN112296_c0_g1_i1:179-1426(+)
MVFGLKLGLSKKQAPAEPPRSEPAAANAKGGGGAGNGGGSGSKGKSALTVNEFVARTKKCRERGLEPTKPELIAYARYLGIDPIIDADLMWIADESLNAPLPSEWTEHNDSADRVFYYNVQTHASSWTHPLEQLHRDTYKTIVSFRSGDLSKEEQVVQLEKLRRKCEEAEQEAHRELQAWTEHVDEQGQKFYYNRDHQRSTWTDPRPARCHALYLQMKALRVLSKHCGQSTSASLSRPEPIRLDLGNPSADMGGQGNGDWQDNDNSMHEGKFDDNDLELVDNRKKRKKDKKNRDKQMGGQLSGELEGNELAPLRQEPFRPNTLKDSPDSDGVDMGGGFVKPAGLDLKKPSTSHVEEVRATLGLTGPGKLPALGRSMRGPMMDANRLPTPPGDGLQTVGRAKVRAGIRLEPLRAGA